MTPSVAADVGGTFTDCVTVTEEGVHTAKVPSTADQSEGVVCGVGSLAAGQRFGKLVHGSTVATNALLERRGADMMLVTDDGFEDVIEIGRQDRPSLYDVFADRPEALVRREDRLGLGDLEAMAAAVAARRPDAVAVSLAYSFADPGGELAVGRRLAQLGIPVSLSHEVVAEFREFERTSTTVLNAYLAPSVSGYLSRLDVAAGDLAGHLEVMRSSGGLMSAGSAAALPAALLLSGPAGGVVAATALARARGYGRVVTFDMGGTSTDVCRIEEGTPEVGYERSVGGFACRMPSVAVHTVGAGGGSLAWADEGGSLRVGPQSAGANPGPAAYGLGGEDVTVTDAHLVLGRIDPATRLGGSLALDSRLAQAALGRLGEALDLDSLTLAAGVVEVVEAHMERAIRAVSVEQGADPRSAVLLAYGGAGGLHASSLARRLGMRMAVIPPFAGVFSALGLLMAPARHDGARSLTVNDASADQLAAAVATIADEVSREYTRSQGHAPARVSSIVDVRYVGQAHELSVPIGPGDGFATVAASFHAAHAEVNGFSRADDPVEIVTVRAVALGESGLGWDALPALDDGPLPDPRPREIVIDGRAEKADLWQRAELPAGAVVTGPAVIVDDLGTTVLEAGDRARVDTDGTIEVTW